LKVFHRFKERNENDKLKGGQKTIMKKCFLTAILIAFALSVIMMPVSSLASITSSGSANINWSSLSFTITDSTGEEVEPDWTAGNGVETRWSHSAGTTGINSTADPYEGIDSNDGGMPPWTNTFGISTKFLGLNNVTGSADTYSPPTLYDPEAPVDANRIFASSNLTLSSGQTTGDIFAQAVLGGDFTVPTDAFLQVSVPYSLLLQLTSSSRGFNSADVFAGLALYDFSTTDPLTGQSLLLQQDEQSLPGFLTGNGSIGPLSQNGTLNLTYNLLEEDQFGNPFVYDFEAYATAKANASVPEPMSLLLLLSGLAGLAIVRKQLA
jgi:hypothetical protein